MLNLKESKHILALTFSPVHPHTATPPYCVENGAVMIMIIIMAPNDNDDDLHDNDKYRVQATSPTHPEFLVLRHVHCLFNGDYCMMNYIISHSTKRQVVLYPKAPTSICMRIVTTDNRKMELAFSIKKPHFKSLA